MTYSISNDISYRRRNNYYIIMDIKRKVSFKFMFPMNIIWEGIEKGASKEKICDELMNANVKDHENLYNLAIKKLVSEKLIVYDLKKISKNKLLSVNKNFIIEGGHFINKASLIITDKCNFKCIHCYNKGFYSVDKKILTLDDWKRVIDELILLGCLEVMITGGEPFIYPEIFKLFDYLEEKRMIFTINTNGSLINDICISKLSQYHMLKEINISLYGLCKDTYKKITNKLFDPQDIFNLYIKLKKSNIETRLQYVYMESNYDDAMKIFKFERKSDIYINKTYYYIFKSLSGINNVDMNLKSDQLMQLYKNNCIKLLNNCNPLLNCSYERCSINLYGDVSICEKMQDIKLGNILTNKLNDIWFGSHMHEYLNSCKTEYKCIKCDIKQYCPRCNGLSFIETGKLKSHISDLCDLAAVIKEIINS